jgi:hypothetical protein
MARLNEKDLLLLSDGKTTSLGPEGGMGRAYLGGKFTENPNDYIQVSIYDTNENFLESSVVGLDDYLYNDGKLKLKTGTILRKMGYDRGRYVVKYNFFRRLAGSYQNILVDSNNNRYFGDYLVDEETGKITDPSDNRMYLKEYKYYIHEISPSRREVRLAPQRISDSEYIEDFYELQTELKRMESNGTIGFVGDTNDKGDSLQMEYVINENVAGSQDNSFPDEVINGTLVLHNVFSQPLKTHSLTTAEGEEEETTPDPTYPAGTGAVPGTTVTDIQPGTTYDEWTWYYFARGAENDQGVMVGTWPAVGWFKDTNEDGWEYYRGYANMGHSYTYVPEDEWPPEE